MSTSLGSASAPGSSSANSGQVTFDLPLANGTILASQPDAIDIDTDAIAQVEQQLKKYAFMFKGSSKRRKAIAFFSPVTYSAGKTLKTTASGRYAQAGGFSIGGREALKHLNDVLRANRTDGDTTFGKFLNRLDQMPSSRLTATECNNPFQRSKETWLYILAAAVASQQVYNDVIMLENAPNTPVEQPSGQVKALSVFSQFLDGKHVIIVTVRGTVSISDWFVNFNGAPKRCKKLLRGLDKWHSGFVVVALAMRKRAAKLITAEHKKHPDCSGIIFTGHSAGAAIAQIFFAMTKKPRSRMAQSVSKLNEVHCISFATPPVADIVIPHDQDADKPGHFINIVNECDPVALAQEGYIDYLLKLFATSDENFDEMLRNGAQVPTPVLKGSGVCVVLKSTDPDALEEQVEAFEIDRTVLDAKVFGNPFVHSMSIYLERIQSLAKRDAEEAGEAHEIAEMEQNPDSVILEEDGVSDGEDDSGDSTPEEE